MAEKSKQYGTHTSNPPIITILPSKPVSANPLPKSRNMAQVHEDIAEMITSALKKFTSKKPEHIQEHRTTALEKMLCLPQMGDSGFHADDISLPVSPKVSEKCFSSSNNMGSSYGTGIVRDTSRKLLYSYVTLKSDVEKDFSDIQFESFQIKPSAKSITNIRNDFAKSKAVDMLKVDNYDLSEEDGPEILLKVSEISFDSALSANYMPASNVKKFFTGFCETNSFPIQPMHKNIISTKNICKNLKRANPLDEVSNEPLIYDGTQDPKNSSERTTSTNNTLKSKVKKELSELPGDSVKNPQNKNITNIKRVSQNLKSGDPSDAGSNELSICDGTKAAVKTRKQSSEKATSTHNSIKCSNKNDPEFQIDSSQIQPKNITNIKRDSQNSKKVDPLVVGNESSKCDGTKAAVKPRKHSSERTPPTNNTLKGGNEKDTFELQVALSQIQPQNKNITNIKRDSLNSRRADSQDAISNQSSVCEGTKAVVNTRKRSSERATTTQNTVKGGIKNDPEFQIDSSQIQPKNKSITNIKRNSQNSKKADVVRDISVCDGTLLKAPKISPENPTSTSDTLKSIAKKDKQIQSQNRNVTRNSLQKDNVSDAASNEIPICDGTKTSAKVPKISSDKTPSTMGTVSSAKKDVQIQTENKTIASIRRETQNLQEAIDATIDKSLIKIKNIMLMINKSSISDWARTSFEVPKISSDKTTDTALKSNVKKDLKIEPENKNITNTKKKNSQTKYNQEVVSNESSKCDETKKSRNVPKISPEKITSTHKALKSNVKRDLQVQSEKNSVTNTKSDSQNSQKTNVLVTVSNDSSISDGAKTTVKVPKISSEKTTNNAVKNNVRNYLKNESENKIVTNSRSDFYKLQKANIVEEIDTESLICDETKAATKIPKISPKKVLSSNLTLKGNTKEESSEGQVGVLQKQPQNKSVSNTRNDPQNSNEPSICDEIKELLKTSGIFSERAASLKQPISAQGTLQTAHSPTEEEKQETKLKSVLKKQPQGITELKVVRELACKLIHEKLKNMSNDSITHEDIPVQDAAAERVDLLFSKGHRFSEKDHPKLHRPPSNSTIRKDTKRLEHVVKDLCHTIMACAPEIENPSQVITYLEHLTKTVFSCKNLGPRTSQDNIRDLITHRLFCTRGNNSDPFSVHLHPQEKEDIFNHFRRELDNLRLRVKFPDKWP